MDNNLNRILIICSHNSARSQMAEAFFRQYASDLFEVHSAGLDPVSVHPLAIQAMAEIGIDISTAHAKSIRTFMGKMSFHTVITVCPEADRQCPAFFPGALQFVSWPFEDPAAFVGTPDEQLAHFRNVRDQIQAKVWRWALNYRLSQGRRLKVLFVCTHNSARSQMAEAFLEIMFGDAYEVFSAGVEPGVLNPNVVKSMAELDVDISARHAKGVELYLADNFDFIVTVCDRAQDTCPYFPGGAVRLHWSFPDPSQIQGTLEEILEQIRPIRDEIKLRIVNVFGY